MVVKNKNKDDSSCEGVRVDATGRVMEGSVKKALVERNKESKYTSYDLDIQNAELLIDRHSSDPFGVMRIQKYDSIPMAKETDDVVVRVLASTVSDIDCRIRDGTYKWNFGQAPTFPIVPGIDVVGEVTSVGALAAQSGLEPGDKIAALSMKGCTAKYITLKFDEVIKIPDSLDSAEAVVVIRTYTAAFQVLMTNIQLDRYSRKPLEGEKILIVGSCGAFERAVIELAVYMGAKSINFWCPSSSGKSHDNYIRMLGARPLSDDPDDWIDKLEGKIDTVIDSACVDRFEYSWKALKSDGILVCTGMSEYDSKKNDFVSAVEKTWVQATFRLSSNFYFYDGIIKSYEKNVMQFMKDLIFLFSLLNKGKIKPKIALKIPMKKVADAQEKIDSNSDSYDRRGVTIVDPWLLDVDELEDNDLLMN